MTAMYFVFLYFMAIYEASAGGRYSHPECFGLKKRSSKNRLDLRYFNELSLSSFDIYDDMCLYG